MTITMTKSAFSHPDVSLVVGAGIHYEIQQFLFREALLLDHERYDEWLALLAPDVRYRTPARFARELGIEMPTAAAYFEDDRRSLTDRIHRLQASRRSADGVQAPTQYRRLITNIIVCSHSRVEYDVLSYLLIARGDRQSTEASFLIAERYDRIRRSSRSFKIFGREIVIDQMTSTNARVEIFL